MYMYMWIFWARNLDLFITFSLDPWTKVGWKQLLQEKYALFQMALKLPYYQSLDQEGYTVV